MVTAWLSFSPGKGSWEKLAGAEEGVEKDDESYRQYRASGLLIRKPVFTGLIDEGQPQTEL